MALASRQEARLALRELVPELVPELARAQGLVRERVRWKSDFRNLHLKSDFPRR